MTFKTIPIRVNLELPNGLPASGVRVEATLTAYEVDGLIVVPQLVYGVTDDTGSLILNLWPNARGVAGSQYRVTAKKSARGGGGSSLLDVIITVPDITPVAEIALETLINAEPYPAIDASLQALIGCL